MPKHILLVEDSVTMQKVVQITFAREDYQITSTTSADEALARIKETKPDVVLADAGLPGKSGYDLAAAIKAEAASRDVAVLLLTGNFNLYDEARGQRAGIDAHIIKPFDTQALIDKVNDLVRRRSAGVSAQAASPAAPSEQRQPAPALATPARAPAPSAITPSGQAIGGRPAAPVVPAAAAAAAAAAASAEQRSTLMGIPTVNPLGTPGLRPPLPVPPGMRVREGSGNVPATNPAAPPAANLSAPAAGGRAEAVNPEGVRMPEPMRAAPGAATVSSAAGISTQVPQMPRPSLIPRAPVPAPVLAALERIAARGAEYEAIAKLSAEAIQQIVWEVVPELAEIIIRSELDRHLKERKA